MTIDRELCKQRYGFDPAEQLRSYTLIGKSELLRQQMLEDQFVLDKIAILGQWTTLFGGPNTGKTLLVLWMIKEKLASGDLDGDQVFYINADDNFRGIVEKTCLAEDWGFHMLAPNLEGFKTTEVVQLLEEFADKQLASGVVIILDTLKKFTDMMNKTEASNFGSIAREFVAAGGTLIALAHVNKHKSADGKSVHSGTSDIPDDSDCVYILDKVSGSQSDTSSGVELVNIKSRGDVADKVAFRYERRIGQTYEDLLESVRRIDDVELGLIKERSQLQQTLEDNGELIREICNQIRLGVTEKTKLIKAVNDSSGFSHNKIRSVLSKHEGDLYSLGHRWRVKIGDKNKHQYELVTERAAPFE